MEDPQKRSNASRIMERMKKNRSQKTEDSVVEENSQEKENVEKKIVQKEPKKAIVTLNEDMVRVRQAHQEGLLEVDDILEALLIQLDRAKEKKILEILRDRHRISDDQYANLQKKYTSSKNYEIIKKENDIDLRLADILVKYHILERNRAQSLFRIQSILHRLGLYLSLEKILLEGKILAPEMVKPLVVECIRRKEGRTKVPSIGSTMRVKREDLEARGIDFSSKEKEKQKKQIFIIAGCIFLIFLIFIIIPSGKKRKRTIKISSKTQKTEPQKKPTPEKKNPDIFKRKPKKVEPKKITKKIRKPSQIHSCSIAIALKKRIQYTKRSIKIHFTMSGVPERKKSIPLYIELWDLEKNKPYHQKKIFSQEEIEEILELPKPLSPGIYYIQMYVNAGKYGKSEIKFWVFQKYAAWFHFLVGSPEESNQYITNNLNQLKKMTQSIAKQYKIFQKRAKKPSSKAIMNWEKWKKKWQRKYEKMFVEQKKYLIPFCSPLQKDIMHLFQKLETLYAGMHSYINELSITPPDMLPEHQSFISLQEKILEKISLKRKKFKLQSK